MKTKFIVIVAGTLLFETSVFAQTAGQHDLSFGIGGYVVNDLVGSTGEIFYDMVTLPDDKFIMAGYTNVSNKNILLVKFKADGEIDSTFGNNGVSEIDATIGGDEEAWAIEVLYDGKLLITGALETMTGINGFVMRLNSDGTVDNSFGTGGTGKTEFNAGSNILTIGADIHLLAGGNFLIGATLLGVASQDMGVFKFTQGGGQAVSFGTGGVSIIDFGGDERLYDLDVLSDGRIVAVGYTENATTNGAIALIKSNGEIDSSFSMNGLYDFDEGSGLNVVTSVAVTPDDKIFVAGSEGVGDDVDGFIMKFSNTGNFDISFSTDGKLFSDIGMTNGIYLYGISLIEDNRVLTTGYIDGQSLTSTYALMVESNGSPVTDFAPGGDTDFGFTITVNSILGKCSSRQSNGSILVGGYLTSPDFVGENMYIIRITNFNYAGIEDLNANNEDMISIYPNPANNYFLIHKTFEENIKNVYLMTLDGRLIHSYPYNANHYNIPSDIANGTYIVNIETENGMISKKLILMN